VSAVLALLAVVDDKLQWLMFSTGLDQMDEVQVCYNACCRGLHETFTVIMT
jgi:hypothetical protein